MTKLQVSETGSTNRVEVQVARMIVVMVLAFLVTWLPYAAMALAVITDSTLHIDPVIATIPVYLAKSSTVYNPIIYIFMNRQVFLRQRTAALDAPPFPRLTVCRVCVCVFPVPGIRRPLHPVRVEPVGGGADVRGGDGRLRDEEPESLT